MLELMVVSVVFGRVGAYPVLKGEVYLIFLKTFKMKYRVLIIRLK